MRHSPLLSRLIRACFIFSLLIVTLAGCTNHQSKHSAVSQQRFDDIDFWVKLFEDPERDKWQKPAEVIKNLGLKSGDTIADIGAGTGYFTRRFAVAVGPEGRAIGLDISQSMVRYMKEDAQKLNLSNYEARVVKTDDPELPAGSIDVVFLSNTYHHLEDRVVYFKKVAKSFTENGRIVIVDFYDKLLSVGPQEPGHKLSKKVVLAELEQAGYRLLKSLDFLPYQYYLEFAL